MNSGIAADDSLEELSKDAVEYLTTTRTMLGISESVTGGNIAACLTGVSGCSKVLFASQVIYAMLGKSSFLDIPMATLEQEGTVSAFVINHMLDTMANRFFLALNRERDAIGETLPSHFISLATTGIAGDPIENKPTGFVLIGLTLYAIRETESFEPDIVHHELHEFNFHGTRNEITMAATREAFSMIIDNGNALLE
jgi:nicotinamide mononucleotide (NMN) deamidase PncC